MIIMELNQTDLYGELYERVPAVLFVVMRCVALAIMILNGAVVVCLICRKHEVPKIYALQMICLCGSDIMAGTAVLVVSLVDLDWFMDSVIRCSFALGFFLSSQSTTLYNVMAICINRSVILIRADKSRNHLTVARVLVFSICALFVSFCFCAIPFINWAADQEDFRDTGCSMESVFRERMESAMKVFFATFVAPLIITNILYGYLCVTLRKRQRQIMPSADQTLSAQSRITPTPGKTTQMKNALQTIKEHLIDLQHQPIAGPSVDIIDSNSHQSQNSMIIGASVFNGKQAMTAGLQTSVNPVTKFVQSGPTNTLPPEKKGHQRKAFALLGLILLFLNIFTWPGLIVLMMETVFDSWSLSRGSKFPLFCTISLNSIVNPILYTIRLAEFRKIIPDIFSC